MADAILAAAGRKFGDRAMSTYTIILKNCAFYARHGV